MLALRGGTVYVDPFGEAIADGIVLLEETRVCAAGRAGEFDLPAECRVLDCRGASVTSGFWNCHVHLTERKWADASDLPAAELNEQLRDFTRYGFTSVFDLSSRYENTQAIRRRIDSGEVQGPRIFTTGEGIIPKGGAPPEIVSRIIGWTPIALPEVSDPRTGASATRASIDKGCDGIKVFASGTSGVALSEETMRAIVESGHAHAKPVFVHPNSFDDLRRALSAGVDIVAHTVARATVCERDIATMTETGVALIPTLCLWKHIVRHERVSLQRHSVESVLRQLADFSATGGVVLFGTDYGAVDADPREEYRLMAQAGMGFREILAAATTAPCRRFEGSAAGGTLAEGNAADVVVRNGDISRSVDAFADVRFTIRSGRIIFSA